MKETKKVITALDIGSSKILAVVAEIYKDGTFRVLAQGRTDSQGVRDGNVVSIEEAMPQVKAALVEAFGIAGKMPSLHVCTNISGKSVEGKDSSAEMPLRGRTVNLMDMKKVQNMAQYALELRDDQQLIKSELLYYMLDNQEDEFIGQNPLDAKSSRISAHMHSAVANSACALNRVNLIRRSGMDVSQILPEAWASGYAVLSQDEIQNGAVVIDIGDENGPYVLINPVIIETAGEQRGYEGCLSVPGKTGVVTRPDYAKVKALNEDMEEVILEGEGLLARAFCHEIDHLDGKLYTRLVEGEVHDVNYEEEE